MDNYNPYNIKTQKRKKTVDVASVGLLVGILFPILGLILVYFLMYNSWGFGFYVKLFAGEPTFSAASKPISLAMITNLIPFYYFLNRKAYQSTKGIILGTALYGVVFIIYKFVL